MEATPLRYVMKACLSRAIFWSKLLSMTRSRNSCSSMKPSLFLSAFLSSVRIILRMVFDPNPELHSKSMCWSNPTVLSHFFRSSILIFPSMEPSAESKFLNTLFHSWIKVSSMYYYYFICIVKVGLFCDTDPSSRRILWYGPIFDHEDGSVSQNMPRGCVRITKYAYLD